MEIKKSLEDNLKVVKKELGVGVSFDVIIREFNIGPKRAALIYINGMVDNTIIVEFMEELMLSTREEVIVDTFDKVFFKRLTHHQVSKIKKLEDMINQVLAGPSALLIDGIQEAIIIDARAFPARSPQEPDIEKVSRGSRDGFVEVLAFNTALLRRRIRDPKLRIEVFKVGQRSKTDVALAYIEDITNPKLVETMRHRIEQIKVDGIPMAEKALEEYLSRRKLWNPFPLVRYTERPDAAADHLLEGNVLIIVDNSPSVMIAPTTFFHHLQHTEEYRQNPVTGTYFRWVRTLGVIFSFLLPALWLTLVTTPGLLPKTLEFLGPSKIGKVPLALQFILAEVGIDLFRMASIHTPSPLATALGFIGAFMLGDVAIQVGLFAPETVLYIALAAAGSFATPSYEMGLALRIIRIPILFLVWAFKLPGLLIGITLLFLVLVTTKSFNIPYLWPFIPFNWQGFIATVFRLPSPMETFRPAILKPQDLDQSPSNNKGQEKPGSSDVQQERAKGNRQTGSPELATYLGLAEKDLESE